MLGLFIGSGFNENPLKLPKISFLMTFTGGRNNVAFMSSVLLGDNCCGGGGGGGKWPFACGPRCEILKLECEGR